MRKIIELQYNLSKGINIEHINADEYFAVRRNYEQYNIHCQVRYGAELETLVVEAICEQETAGNIEALTIQTIGGNRDNKYPLNLSDFKEFEFSNLHTLKIPEQTYGQETYIYDGFHETKRNNVIQGILKNCPNLETLVLPCFQDKFHNIKLSKLKSLQIIEKNNPDKLLNALSRTPKKNLPSLERLLVSEKSSQTALNKFLESPIGKKIQYIFLV